MPIEILQKEVQVRDPTTHQFSDLAALRGGQGPQGLTGPGVPAGGTDGDVLVKDGATDYAARWTNTPPQMGSLATIEPTSSASKAYAAGDYLVYNGQLYKATGTISPDETLTPGGNISAVDSGGFNDLNTAIANKTACKRINITSTSEYIVSIGGILCGDMLFVDAVISKNLPSGSYQNLAISLPNSTEGRGVAYPTNYTGSPQSSQPSGSFSFGAASDRNIIGSCRIANSAITICISAAPNVNFFISFCVAYPKNGSLS